MGSCACTGRGDCFESVVKVLRVTLQDVEDLGADDALFNGVKENRLRTTQGRRSIVGLTLLVSIVLSPLIDLVYIVFLRFIAQFYRLCLECNAKNKLSKNVFLYLWYFLFLSSLRCYCQCTVLCCLIMEENRLFEFEFSIVI